MLSKKVNRDSLPITPPDIDNPPSYIPLKSIDGRYQIIEELGNGSFGSVSLARAHFDIGKNHNDGKMYRKTLLNQAGMDHENAICKRQGLVAIKTMMTKLSTLHDYTRVREIKFILSLPANRHLIQIFEIFIDNKNFQLHIVMEAMEQNLYQMMRHRRRRVFSIPSLKSILAQILAGLHHIHEFNFFHRDIKPENILISPSTRYFDKDWLLEGNYTDNYVVKLADFGLARHVTNKNPYTAYVSTRWYRSPEILLRNGYYSRPLDIWAFGCVAVEITIFKPLFPGSNEMDQIWKILEVLGTPHTTKESEKTGYISNGGQWELAKTLAQRLNMKFPYVEGSGLQDLISSSQLQSLADVIKRCLRWDPNERATATDLCSMPFFRDTVAAVPKVVSSTRNTEQAQIFAGIKPSQSNHKRQLIFHSKELEESHLTRPLKINDGETKLKKSFSMSEFLQNHSDDIPLNDPPPAIDTDSTISDNQDEIEFCQISSTFENDHFLKDLPSLRINDGSINESKDNLKRLTDDIDAMNKQNETDFLFDTPQVSNSKNYVHYTNQNPELNLLSNNVLINSDHSSLQPVNRLLDNMSIDDSFNNNDINGNCNDNNNNNLNVIPRSFMLQQDTPNGNHIISGNHIELASETSQHFGNITF
ncbi:hypothetical protein HG536_0F01370 [Torulaspora globosa]|uniref:Protein kinase domain-containing protein n=1 Tax=Torulaspora globosa TaxID=48254 RepID=A0A7G3ZJX6_9SACH|nr:uncharacterized protein HG536_0F01370 [Torulaspora globosa]QLL33812.1 hypothetical protein HG536_0F01370 [Torulaspora globosa]